MRDMLAGVWEHAFTLGSSTPRGHVLRPRLS